MSHLRVLSMAKMRNTLQILMTLVAVGVTTAYPSTPLQTPHASMCPPGAHLAPGGSGRSLLCLPCPPGQFMPTPNRASACLYHQECLPPGEVLLHEGSATRDAVCTCDEGERVYRGHPKTHRYTCVVCSGGRVPKPVLNSQDRGDSGCCEPHQHAYRDSRGELHCHDRVVSLTGNLPAAPAATPLPLQTEVAETNTPEERQPVLWTYAIGSGAVGFFVGLVVAIVVFVIYKMRRLTSTRKAEFLPVKTYSAS